MKLRPELLAKLNITAADVLAMPQIVPQLRMLAFDRLELTEQLVVLSVRERRLIEDVVLVRGAIERGAQLGGPRRGRHSPFDSVAMTCIACIATMTIRSSSSSASFGSSVSAQR